MTITRTDSFAGQGALFVRRDQLTGLRAAAAKARGVVADIKAAWKAAMGRNTRMEEQARREFKGMLNQHAQWWAEADHRLDDALAGRDGGMSRLRVKEATRAIRILDDLLLPPDCRVGKLDWKAIKLNFMVLRACRDHVQRVLDRAAERAEAHAVPRARIEPQPQSAVWAQAHSSWVHASNLRDLRNGSAEPTAVAQGPVAAVEDQALSPELHVAVTRAVSPADVQQAQRDKARRDFSVDPQFPFNPLAAPSRDVMVTSLPERPVPTQVQLSPDGYEHHRHAAVSVQADAAELGSAAVQWPQPGADASAPGKPDA